MRREPSSGMRRTAPLTPRRTPPTNPATEKREKIGNLFGGLHFALYEIQQRACNRRRELTLLCYGVKQAEVFLRYG
jgi:hypothetical protein